MSDVGFIRCSTREQLAGTSALIYGDFQGELLLLEMNSERLEQAGIEVRFEDGGDGRLFPHIYGELPVRLVESVSAFRRA